LAGNVCCLNFKEGIALATVSIVEVRKTLARAGLDVIGNSNDLKRRLAEFNMRNGGGGAAAPGAAPASGGTGGASLSEAASGGSEGLFKAILAVSDDPAAVLTLGAGGATLTSISAPGDVRKAYLRLSMRVHPDKNGGSAESKAAFQAVVLAFERISQPSESGAEAGSASSAASQAPRTRVDTSVNRSNEGCIQTRVECPRCSMIWPRADLGLEDGAYTFFMTAIKEYVCGRCCLTFGCMSARHICSCGKSFDYSPSDFHRTVRCSAAGGCGRSFGFLQAKISPKRWVEVRAELFAAQVERSRRADARARREGRAAARDGGAGGGAGGSADREALFRLELLDACPRCGIDACDLDAPARQEHLLACTDARAHAAHAAAERRARAGAATVAAQRNAASDEASLAVWNANGRVAGQLWVLSHSALGALCVREGLAADGSRIDLIRRFRAAAVARQSSAARLAITDAAGGSSSGGGGGGVSRGSSRGVPALVDLSDLAAVDAAELPATWHILETDALAAIAASFGLPGEANDSKPKLINTLDAARFLGREAEGGFARLGDASERRGALKDKDVEWLGGDDDEERDDGRPGKRVKRASKAASSSG
jgi:hypothetical protein